MAQFARPDSDITVNGWTSSVGGNLYPTIDEVTASDSDYISSQDNTNNAYVAGLSNVDDPNIHTGHIVRYRYRKDAAGGHSIDFQVELRQGETVIATGTQHVNIGTGWTAGSFTLTEGEAGNITDYTDLRLYLRRLGDTGGPPGNRRMAECSWAELEVPDAPIAVPEKQFAFTFPAPFVNFADIVLAWAEVDDAAGSTIDLTTTDLGGLTPEGYIIFAQAAAGKNTGTITASEGMSDGSLQHCSFTKSVVGATTDEKTGAFNNAVGFYDDGTNRAYYTHNSFITNGVRLNRTNSGSDPSGGGFLVLFFAGADVNEIELVKGALNQTVGQDLVLSSDVNQPNLARVLTYNTAEAATTSPSYDNHSQKHEAWVHRIMSGGSEGNASSYSRWNYYQNGVTTAQANAATQTDRLAAFQDTAGTNYRAEAVAATAWGDRSLTLTTRDAAPTSGEGNVAVLMMRLNTEEIHISAVTSATATGSDAFTEPGFPPYYLIRVTTRDDGALQTGNTLNGTGSTSESHSTMYNLTIAGERTANPLEKPGIWRWVHWDTGTTGGEIGANYRDSYEFGVTDNESLLNDIKLSGNLTSWDTTGHTDNVVNVASPGGYQMMHLHIGRLAIPAPVVVDIPTQTIDWVGQVPTVDVGAGAVVAVGLRGISVDTSEQIVIDLGIIPPELQIDWVGQVPALDLGINVPEKQIDWVGQVPVLDFAILIPEKQIDWVGDDPGVIEQQPTPLAIDWVGQVPTASIGVRVMVPELQIDWVGRDPFPAVHNPQTELVIDWVGQAPVLDLGIIPPELTIDWVGQTPEPVVSIPTLTIDWVGQTPTVIEAQTELVIDWVGQVPTVLEGADTIIQIPTQTIDWVGRAPVLDLGIIPPELTIDWVGQTPALDLGIIPPELVLTFANSDPFPAVHNPIPEQQIDWVGQVPTVQEGAATVVAVPLQTFDWVGIDPGVIEPQAAPLALSVGLQAPVLDFGISIPERALDWVGQTVGTFAYIPAHPGISITHRTPDLPVPIPTLTIDWLGIEPGIPLVPPAKTLDWVGYAPAPAVSNNIRASPPELTIDWAGYAPLAGMLGSINVLVPEQQIALAHQIALVEFFSLGGLGIDRIELVEAVGIDRIELAPVIDLEEVEQL